MAKDRPDDNGWLPQDHAVRGENYEYNAARLSELGLHLTLGANGQVMVIKHSKDRGFSETLYTWRGPQPQLPKDRSVH